MTDILTAEEREYVELVRGSVTYTSSEWRVMKIIDRLAPKPKPKTDLELAEMLEIAIRNTYGQSHLPAIREVRDALRARGDF